MAIIIGGPNNPNAYVYQPNNPGNTSVSPPNQSQNNQASYTVTGGPHSEGPRKLKKKIKTTTGTSFGPAGGGIGTFSGQNIQSAAAPTPSEVLQSIVDVKDRVKNIPGTGGLNTYQNLIQNFRTSSPANMAAYAERFPVSQFAMTGLPAIVKSMVPGGNVFSMIADAYQSGKEKVMGTVDDTKDKIVDIFTDDENKEQTTSASSIYDYGNIPDPMMSKRQPFPGFRDGIPSILNTSTDTPGSELLFRVPGSSGYMVQKDPNLGPTSAFTDVNKFVDLPNSPGTFIKYNEGGLASLNNKDYGMLMNASNFGF